MALAVTGCAGVGQNSFSASSNFKCKNYSSQSKAQKAWEAKGKPNANKYDRDGDGKVCPSLNSSSGTSKNTTAKTTNCKKPKGVVSIGLSKTKYPKTLQHMEEAIAKGWPRIMILNREGAGARRERLLANIPTKPGFDRDEFPAAVGRKSWKAHVKYVPSSDNRGAGSSMGIKLRQYCDGTRFQIVGY